MKNLSILVIVIFGLLLCAGCCSNDCCKCEKDKSCKSCTCSAGDKDKPCKSCAASADKKATACETCTQLMAGGTGWCEGCKKGFFEGKEVNCKGECAANPGGPPCKECVK
ncbi:MAG: hypothetical protein ABIK28_03620 [Planctomycetota bacterium]